jgi:hypothetical protein
MSSAESKLPNAVAKYLGYEPEALTDEQREAVDFTMSRILQFVAESLAEGWKIALFKGDPEHPVPGTVRVLEVKQVTEGEEPRSELFEWFRKQGIEVIEEG